MRKRNLLVAGAASFMAAGMWLLPARADNAVTGDKPATPGMTTVNPGIVPTTRPEIAKEQADQVRVVLGHVVDAAAKRDGFSELGGMVTFALPNSVSDMPTPPGAKPADKDPAPAATPKATDSSQEFKNSDTLNTVIDQFRKDWKDKYHSDFDINGDNRSTVFNDSFQIIPGDMSDAARLAGETMPPRTPGTPPSPLAVDHGGRTAIMIDPNLVTVCFARHDGKPGMTLLLSRKDAADKDWKIVLPAGARADGIRDVLVSELRTMHDDRDNWPGDQNASYRAVSRRVLSCIGNQSTAIPGGDHVKNPMTPMK